jgi:hypothetical protein
MFEGEEALWLVSPEAFAHDVLWEPWLLRLFKPLCVSRVATAHRTRGNRRTLTAICRQLLSSGVLSTVRSVLFVLPF